MFAYPRGFVLCTQRFLHLRRVNFTSICAIPYPTLLLLPLSCTVLSYPVLSSAVLLMTPCQTKLGRSIIIRATGHASLDICLSIYLIERNDIIQLLTKFLHLARPLFTFSQWQTANRFPFPFQIYKTHQFNRMQQLTSCFFYGICHFDFMTFIYMQLRNLKSSRKVIMYLSKLQFL